MANLINTLYPPQVATFMPAFVNTEDAVVYFSLSPYNESANIQRVHISVVNQLNNENALTKASGIIISDLRYDTTSGMYFVVVPANSIEGGQFNINQFYKIQLRFDTYEGSVPTDEKELNNYLLEYQTYFSEWSTVCLIRPILQPNIQLRTFDTYSTERTIAFNKGIIPISGKLFFGENNKVETETLQSFRVQVLADQRDEIVFESPLIYTGNNLDPNDINYKLDLQSLDTSESVKFRLRIIIVTKNQYTTTKMWDFQIAEFLEEEDFNPDITVEMNNEDGIAVLKITNGINVFGTLHIKRASSIDNFKDWESISTTKVAGPVNITINDNTVGSLIWYRYSVQLENSKGVLTPVYRSVKFLPDFYDAIFSRNGQQLRLQYNYKVSNFKPVVNRAKIDTLGGRFPKFAENAVLNYKQFSIAGTLTAMTDTNEKFLKQKTYFGNEYENFLIHNQAGQDNDFGYMSDNNRIFINKLAYEKNDFFWEREFREEAIKWLNDGEPKLYRSMSEGIMAVMLTDVSLTPNTTLGRRVWDFSATVYEIAEGASLATLDSLGIYSVPKIQENTGGGGSVDPEPEYVTIIKAGQIYQEMMPDKNNILSTIITSRLKEKYGGVLADKEPADVYLKDVKIFFHSQPSLFIQTGEGLLEVEDPGGNNWSDAERARMQLGYTFNVKTSKSEGASTIFVNAKGYYQLPSMLDITDISFPHVGEVVTIEYILVYKERNNETVIISGSSIDKTIVGQEMGVFKPNQYLGEKIRAKYNFVKTGEYYQRMQFWKGICVDVTPFAIVHIQYKGDKTYSNYVVGDTGVLHLLKNFQVQDMCFVGRRMKQVERRRQPYLEEWEYVLDDSIINADQYAPQRTNWYALSGADTGQPVIINHDGVETDLFRLEWGSTRDQGDTPISGSAYLEISEVKDPKYNTVYLIGIQPYIYYIDGLWYPIALYNEGKIGIAAVPIEGMVNYIGDVLRSDY